ncbi:hypothetical protein KEM52_005357 [Ascosphaera acerosa]|nr:hypothetical protein KEM52_005357 [Ascosphaera acerosa]
MHGETSKALSYPLPGTLSNSHHLLLRGDMSSNAIDLDGSRLEASTLARGMSVPPFPHKPHRTDTAISTISYQDNLDGASPSSPAHGILGTTASSSHTITTGGASTKKHSCPHCGTQFTRHHNLKSHLLTHSEEKPHNCDVCDQRFRRRHDMKRHMKLHTGERPHICPRCGRRFARGDALARHAKGPGGCAGRRESGGSSFGMGDSMDILDPTRVDSISGGGDGEGFAGGVIENHADAGESQNDRSASSPSATTAYHRHRNGEGGSDMDLDDDEGPDRVKVTVSDAIDDISRQADSDRRRGPDGPDESHERMIFTEPDLMDEEDVQNTPWRRRRSVEASIGSRIVSPTPASNPAPGLRHKHHTAPDTHHLHPSSAYDHIHHHSHQRHGRRTPQEPSTYPLTARSPGPMNASSDFGNAAAARVGTSPILVMPATSLPSPVSRANSGNSSDPKADNAIGHGASGGALSAGLGRPGSGQPRPGSVTPSALPAVSISDSPESISPKYQGHKRSFVHLDDRSEQGYTHWPPASQPAATRVAPAICTVRHSVTVSGADLTGNHSSRQFGVCTVLAANSYYNHDVTTDPPAPQLD